MQCSFRKISKTKQYHKEVLRNGSHLNGHTFALFHKIESYLKQGLVVAVTEYNNQGKNGNVASRFMRHVFPFAN